MVPKLVSESTDERDLGGLITSFCFKSVSEALVVKVCGVQEMEQFFSNCTCEIYVWVICVKIVDYPLKAVSRASQNVETVIDEAFLNERLFWVCVDKILFEFAHGNIGIAGNDFGADTGA